MEGPSSEPPSDETLAQLRGQIEHLMRNGPDPERKAIVQALVEGARVVSRAQVVPTFRLPEITSRERFLRLMESVVPTGRHKNRTTGVRVDAVSL